MNAVPGESANLATAVCAVVVTYGSRRHLLQEVSAALPAQGLVRLVVVNNGADWDVVQWADTVKDLDIDVVCPGRNTGSAAGFAAGIKRALELGSELIWLLDDDNRPEAGALDVLIDRWQERRRTEKLTNIALLAFRSDHQADIAMGVPLERCHARNDSFFGFHLWDIPYKVWRRTPWGRPTVSDRLPAIVVVPQAPYGGLLIHRSVIERIGLPDENFVLYGDDTEFSARFVAGCGIIELMTDAHLADLEASWNIKARYSNSFVAWLCGDGELRAFYGARNLAYLNRRRSGDSWTFKLNRCVYLVMLGVYALVYRRLARFRLLLKAIKKGERGILGMDGEYRLR